jgi:hypothetical protein
MDRLLSPPSLSSLRSFVVLSQPTFCAKLRALFRLQLTWFSGLLLWIGFWDASDLLYAYMDDLDGVPVWLQPLIEVIIGAAGLTAVLYLSHVNHPLLAARRGTTEDRTLEEHGPNPLAEPLRSPANGNSRHASVAPSLASLPHPAMPTAVCGACCPAWWRANGVSASASLVGLFVVMCDLMMYVGLWNIIDYSVLDELPYCDPGVWDNPVEHAASRGSWCVPEVAVKLALGVVGACGLTATGGLACAANGFVGDIGAIEAASSTSRAGSRAAAIHEASRA